jgi:tRNA A37 threonylcarbamoyladenosine dehydratase
MGAGGKTDPNKVQIADISQTRECPLSKYTRKRLRRRGISKGIKVVFSDEAIQNDSMKHTDGSNYKKSFYGTISYMPALFGLRAAAEVIQYLTKKII